MSQNSPPKINTPEINTDDLSLQDGCQFRIWSKAELKVEDVQVTLEGSQSALMLALLRNRGRRVPLSTLWAAMVGKCELEVGDGSVESVEAAVSVQIRQMRYMLCARGILLAVDDSDPDDGLMFSGLCRIETKPADISRKRSRSRKTHRPGTQACYHHAVHKHGCPPEVAAERPDSAKRYCVGGDPK
jgi:hypothetical protein